eukprot:5966516-Prymnesium_polylepis.1
MGGAEDWGERGRMCVAICCLHCRLSCGFVGQSGRRVACRREASRLACCAGQPSHAACARAKRAGGAPEAGQLENVEQRAPHRQAAQRRVTRRR